MWSSVGRSQSPPLQMVSECETGNPIYLGPDQPNTPPESFVVAIYRATPDGATAGERLAVSETIQVGPREGFA